jgi:hypothetical protein
MSTYYYMICQRDRTKVFFATSSQSGPLRIQEEASQWLLDHMGEDIKLTTEHNDDLYLYDEEE